MVKSKEFGVKESVTLFLAVVVSIMILVEFGLYTGRLISVDQTYTNNSVLRFEISEEITSLNISGSMNGVGSVRIYLVKDSLDVMLFERERVTHDYSLLGPTENLGMVLNYANGTWDTDNDGIESIDGVVDLSVSGNDSDNLCTIWAINTELVCKGSSDCCAIANVDQYSEEWDEDLYLHIGRFGAGLENNVSSKLVYFDLNNTEFIESVWRDLPVTFVEDVDFSSLAILNMSAGNYTIFVDIEDAGVHIDSINLGYSSIEEEIVVEEEDIESVNRSLIRLGEPVKWTKKVKVKSNRSGVNVVIPTLAQNVNIKKIENATGVISDIVQPVGRRSAAAATSENKTVSVNEEISAEDEIIVEYETEAPYAEESVNGTKKEVVINGPDELHYTNIVAFAELPIEVDSVDDVVLNWVTGGVEAEFDAYDTDDNGLLIIL